LIADMVKEQFAPEWPGKPKLNHGIGGVISLEDIPGKRNKGSLAWSGAANSRWVSVFCFQPTELANCYWI